MPSEEQGAAERFFEDLGYQCENTEFRSSRKGGSKIYDLLGFVDFMAFQSAAFTKSIVFVQATDRSNASTRWNKIRAEPRAALLLRAGGCVALAAVGKQGKRFPQSQWPSVDVRIATYSDWKNTESWRDLDRWPEG